METDKSRNASEAERARKDRDTIGDGLATQICDKYARQSIRFPIKKSTYSNASGEYEKTVTIYYSVDKSTEDPRITYAQVTAVCKLKGRDIVDYIER